MGDRVTVPPVVPGPRQSTPDRRRRRPRLFGVLALVLIAAGGVIWLVRAPAPAPTETRPGQSPAPSTTTVDASERASSVADFEAIYRELEATRVRAYEEYRPELLDEVYGPDCPAACGVEPAKKAIGEMGAAGARFSDRGPRILEVELVGEFEGAILENAPRRMVTIRVVDEQDPFHVILKDGTRSEPHPGWEATSRAYDMYFSPAKRHWLINNRFVEGPVADLPPASPEEIE